MKIQTPELGAGEIYAGGIVHPDGSGYRLILLKSKHHRFDWESAMQWAKDHGGDLPTRVELLLLWEKFNDRFKPEWYWSNEQKIHSPEFAWCQNFIGGSMNHDFKYTSNLACIVRREPI